MHPIHIRQVGGNIALGDIDAALLDIAGLGEKNLAVNQIQLDQQAAGDHAVKIRPRHQSKRIVTHGQLSDITTSQ
jgi:hypothetical protein